MESMYVYYEIQQMQLLKKFYTHRCYYVFKQIMYISIAVLVFFLLVLHFPPERIIFLCSCNCYRSYSEI